MLLIPGFLVLLGCNMILSTPFRMDEPMDYPMDTPQKDEKGVDWSELKGEKVPMPGMMSKMFLLNQKLAGKVRGGELAMEGMVKLQNQMGSMLEQYANCNDTVEPCEDEAHYCADIGGQMMKCLPRGQKGEMCVLKMEDKTASIVGPCAEELVCAPKQGGIAIDRNTGNTYGLCMHPITIPVDILVTNMDDEAKKHMSEEAKTRYMDMYNYWSMKMRTFFSKALQAYKPYGHGGNSGGGNPGYQNNYHGGSGMKRYGKGGKKNVVFINMGSNQNNAPGMGNKLNSPSMNPGGYGMGPGGDGMGPGGDGMGPGGDGMGPDGDGMGPDGDGMGPDGDGMGPDGEGMGPDENEGEPPVKEPPPTRTPAGEIAV